MAAAPGAAAVEAAAPAVAVVPGAAVAAAVATGAAAVVADLSARGARPTWKMSSARARERLKNLIPGGFGSYKGITLVVLGALLIWLATGLFRVQPNQQAIQLVFGKPYGKPVEPGLHYNLPAPIGNVVVVNVQDQRRTVIGSATARSPRPTAAATVRLPPKT